MSHIRDGLRKAALGLALAGVCGGWFGTSASALSAEELPVDSLTLAPADAVYYSATLRGREQYDLVMQSNAWRKAKNMPMVQLGMMLLQLQLADPQSPVAQAKEMLDAPENQELIGLLAEMAGKEMFVYGSADYLQLLELFQKLQTNNQYGPIIAAMRGDDVDQADVAAEQQQQMVQMLVDNLDLLVVPDTVFGFKIENSDPAHAQLDRLESLLEEKIAEEPKLEGSLTRKTVGDVEYLTLILTGEMLPWEEWEAEIPEGEQRDQIIDHVKAMTIEINLGLREDFVILSIGDNSDHLAKLGEGKSLVETAEIEKLSEHAEERITSIVYASEALMSYAGGASIDLEGLNDLAEDLLEDAEVDDDLKARIKDDVAELAEDMADYVPEPGAIASISFLTDTGTESYTYNWGTNPLVDGDKPLSLLNHLGGDPLVACVGRGKYSPDSYATLVKWLKKAHAYFEDFGVPKMDAEERDKYHAVWPELVPLLERLDKITGEMFLPSLADGQSAFVLDAKMSSYHWLKNAPATAEEMPLIEPAVVCGVTDGPLLLKAMGEYRTLLNDTLDKMEEIGGEEARTEFRLEAPEIRKFEFGDVYYYRLPEEAGVDKRLAPNGGLNDEVAAISISPRTTVRMLESTPLEVEGILSTANDVPAFGACYVNLADLLDALAPWIDLGIRVGMSEFSNEKSERVLQDEEKEEAETPGVLGDPAEDTPNTRQVLSQVHAVLDIIKVYQNYQSLSYMEDGIQVTHSAWLMIDTE